MVIICLWLIGMTIEYRSLMPMEFFAQVWWSRDSQLHEPRGIYDGKAYIADYKNFRISVFLSQ